ncbi:YlmC/YmxH family sporulation protein [Thermoanaerobacterium sp. RBIITD]|uniref:YlmC/YmxH family sporulation protein n=1 Tax=Thermoanaerobacterium sp. RBIITD TaxID=1550240 RepID=UPI000BB8C2D4|nr:YlmC/YmxH family sporulation protein [Thermoanaerobacterium sp. RBIITD]SNX55464.1 sporulation protein, YlmC/YmxH family [Thermoanaerobacterium sp. RBIITD]
MRLSEFGYKEIVNLNDGKRLGLIEDSDLIIDENTGEINSIIVYEAKGSLFRNKLNYIEIPWEFIKKIGNDMIIVEMETEKNRRYL